MAISAATVANSIAGLSVSGVAIKDVDELQDEFESRDCPVIFPVPENFLSAFDVERMAMSSGTANVWNVSYTMTYRLLYDEVGMGRGMFDVYDGMIDKAMLFVDKILVSDSLTGAVDIELEDVFNIGPVSDPSGKVFHGCDISLRILEFE
jgi:hypothetical protein